MKLKRIAVKNIKKIESLDVEFNGNVFAIAGDNEVGKSTLLQLILQSMTYKNKIPVPVTQGKDDGFALFEYEAPGGMPYQVRMEYEKNGKEKLTLMAPGGIKSSKVTDLRNVFDYHDVSVEEFMLWSDTKDGRKKQADLLLSIFPEDVQQNFISAIAKEKEFYESRATINKEVDILTKQLKGYEMTPEQLEHIKKKEKFLERQKKLNEYKKNSVNQYADLKIVAKDITAAEEKLAKDKEDFPTYKAQLKKSIDESAVELEELKEKVRKAENALSDLIQAYDKAEEIHNENIDSQNKSLKVLYEKQAALNKALISEEKLEESEQKITEGLDYIKRLETTNTLRLDVAKSLDKKKEEQAKVEKDLADIRTFKESILLEQEMPIEGLAIEEEGLTYKGLPFDKNQISTSQFMQVVLKILIAINKKTPIIPIGRAESFGKKKLNEIIALAEKENCQIFFEKVKDEGELTIEVFEDDVFKTIEQKDVADDLLTKKKEKVKKELPANWKEKVKQLAEKEEENEVPANFDDEDDDDFELDLGTTMFDEV